MILVMMLLCITQVRRRATIIVPVLTAVYRRTKENREVELAPTVFAAIDNITQQLSRQVCPALLLVLMCTVKGKDIMVLYLLLMSMAVAGRWY